jgi:hypothetical protein
MSGTKAFRGTITQQCSHDLEIEIVSHSISFFPYLVLHRSYRQLCHVDFNHRDVYQDGNSLAHEPQQERGNGPSHTYARCDKMMPNAGVAQISLRAGFSQLLFHRGRGCKRFLPLTLQGNMHDGVLPPKPFVCNQIPNSIILRNKFGISRL